MGAGLAAVALPASQFKVPQATGAAAASTAPARQGFFFADVINGKFCTSYDLVVWTPSDGSPKIRSDRRGNFQNAKPVEHKVPYHNSMTANGRNEKELPRLRVESSKNKILVQEKVKQSEPWNSTKGIYADFSDGFDKPKYYCRCPNCNYVHGHYASPREAILKRHCPGCDAKGIEKLKKDIRKVDEPVKHRPVEPQRIFVESLVENLLCDQRA